MIYGQVPPQAIELEESLLAAFLVDKSSLEHLDSVKAEYFYKTENGLIFEAILALNASGQAVDLLTVTEKLRAMGELENVGGAYHITSLCNKVASAAHLEHHILIIKQKYIRRELITVNLRTMRNAYDDTFDELALLADHEKEIEKIGVSTITRDAEQIGNVLTSIFNSEVNMGLS